MLRFSHACTRPSPPSPLLHGFIGVQITSFRAGLEGSENQQDWWEIIGIDWLLDPLTKPLRKSSMLLSSSAHTHTHNTASFFPHWVPLRTDGVQDLRGVITDWVIKKWTHELGEAGNRLGPRRAESRAGSGPSYFWWNPMDCYVSGYVNLDLFWQ